MHEGKSCLSATLLQNRDEVKMELDLTIGRPSDGPPDDVLSLRKQSGLSGTSVLGGTSTTGSSGGSGSAGEDSSSDEPLVAIQSRRHRHSLPPKKYRLKDSSSVTLSLQPIKVSTPFQCFPDQDDTKEDRVGNPDDDEYSQKDGGSGLQHSFTSGENSDSEMCGGYGDGDECKHEGDDVGKKIFECDICNMKFSNGANMRRHRMRHTGVKPFECRVCQKRFFRKDHLAEHMATHSKLLPFRCPICNKGFQRQIAMRAHFQNAHVGGSHDVVKACPLCSYKSGSMKSLRAHFYSRHGIDLDNPLPHSPSLQVTSNGRVSPTSPGPTGGPGEYSELAHALGFESGDKTDTAMIPSHFLVPQIEITSNSHYTGGFPFTADSSYDGHGHDRRRHRSNPDDNDSSSPKVSPKSDSSSSNIPSSSDLVVVKREVLEADEVDSAQLISSGSSSDDKPKSSGDLDSVQEEGPEDLSASQSKAFRLKMNSASLIKISPLKSLLGEDWKKDYTRPFSIAGRLSRNSAHGGGTDVDLGSSEGRTSRELSLQNPNSNHQCIYCKIYFPDITLYFLHKGCHSESSPWRCNICGEACCNVYDFNSHLLSKSHQ